MRNGDEGVGARVGPKIGSMFVRHTNVSVCTWKVLIQLLPFTETPATNKVTLTRPRCSPCLLPLFLVFHAPEL